MPYDLVAYRNSPNEKLRISDLMSLVPHGLDSALDVGARDCFLSKKLLERIPRVTALDLQQPVVDDPRIVCVEGNATALPFPDASFDLVLCAEVLEHIPRPPLETVCRELARVAKKHVLIGVPYRQDTRVGRATCAQCGKPNPPWGHVNEFDEHALTKLFAGLRVERRTFVGISDYPTNRLSAWLMDLAGNPYGQYAREEPCIYCGQSIGQPKPSGLPQKALAKTALLLQAAQRSFVSRHGNWIHLLFSKD